MSTSGIIIIIIIIIICDIPTMLTSVH